MTPKQIPWLRVFVEGVVIVGSILLALALDEWRDGVRERGEETAVLERLSKEFVGVDSVMRAWQAHHQAVLDNGEALLAHTGPDPSTLGSDSIGALVGRFAFLWTVNPPDGVFSSLIASGQLDLIVDAELRDELASWQSLLGDLHGDEDIAVRTVEDHLMPYLYAHLSMRSVAALTQDYPRTTSHFPDGFSDLLSDREFESLVEGRMLNTFWIVESYKDALKSVAAIRSLIQSELNR